MEKKAEIQKEYQRIREIFSSAAPKNTLKLIEGLLEETAYLRVELTYLRSVLEKTGMIKVDEYNLTHQKALPISNEYRRTVNVYALNIKVLNSILGYDFNNDEDPLADWLKKETKSIKEGLKTMPGELL